MSIFYKATARYTDALIRFVEKEYDEAKKCASRKKWSKADQAMIETATLEDLEATMEREINQATHHQAGFKKNASHGARAERGVMKFLDDFSAYVQAYKGVVDVMKGAGFGQGEAAYGALQLLVIVSVTLISSNPYVRLI